MLEGHLETGARCLEVFEITLFFEEVKFFNVSIHVNQAGLEAFGQFGDLSVFTDNVLSAGDDSLDIGQKDENRSRKNQKKQKEDKGKLLLDTKFQRICTTGCSSKLYSGNYRE